MAHVDEEADVARRRGLIEIGVLADDHRRLATQLQGDLFEVAVAGRYDNFVADGRGPGEGHLLNVHVVGDQVARRVAVAVDDVDDAGREASLLDEVAHHQA